MLGPPRHGRARSPEELRSYGYAGQGYPIYGQAGDGSDAEAPSVDPTPAWFADPASSAYAFGYTTSMRSNPVAAGPRSSRGHAGKGPKDYLRADSRIREDVCDRLSDDDEVDATDISVDVVAGEVTLSGTVVDRYMKRRAENIAASVRGVIDVLNQLSVQKGLLRELSDKITGGAPEEHHGHHGSGTRPSPPLP